MFWRLSGGVATLLVSRRARLPVAAAIALCVAASIVVRAPKAGAWAVRKIAAANSSIQHGELEISRRQALRAAERLVFRVARRIRSQAS